MIAYVKLRLRAVRYSHARRRLADIELQAWAASLIEADR